MTTAAPFENPDLPTSWLANTESELLNTTKMPPNMALQVKSQAEYTYRKGASRWRHALVTVYADQVMTLFSYDLSGQVASPAANGSDWRVNVAAGAASTANIAFRYVVPMFGDDTKITLKSGGTPPTTIKISIELSEDQVSDT